MKCWRVPEARNFNVSSNGEEFEMIFIHIINLKTCIILLDTRYQDFWIESDLVFATITTCPTAQTSNHKSNTGLKHLNGWV